MPNLVPVVAKPTKLIVCPATVDGMVCAVILSRAFKSVDYQLFYDEDQIAKVLEYPAIKEAPRSRDLIIAGFPLPDEQVSSVVETLRLAPSDNITWYSHHFWSTKASHALAALKVNLHVDSQKYSTAELLLSAFYDSDDFSLSLAAAMFKGPENAGEFSEALYMLHGLSGDLYDIRHALKPLIDGRISDVDPQLCNIGKEHYLNLKSDIEAAAYYRIPIGDRKLVVSGFPGTYRKDYHLLSSLLASLQMCDLVVMFFDGVNQVLIRQGIMGLSEIDFIELAQHLEKHFGDRVRLYDRNMLLLGPVDDIRGEIENLTRALEEFDFHDS